MHTALLFCALSASVVAGCRGRDRAQGNPAQTASVITAENDTTATRNARQQTHQGKELEAPQRLTGFLPQLDRMSKEPLADFNQNLTAYKFELSRVIDAMTADLTRAGVPEGEFRTRAQQVLEQVGGGTGTARAMSEQERRKFINDVRQLIQQYQTAMKAGQRPGEAR